MFISFSFSLPGMKIVKSVRFRSPIANDSVTEDTYFLDLVDLGILLWYVFSSRACAHVHACMCWVCVHRACACACVCVRVHTHECVCACVIATEDTSFLDRSIWACCYGMRVLVLAILHLCLCARLCVVVWLFSI